MRRSGRGFLTGGRHALGRGGNGGSCGNAKNQGGIVEAGKLSMSSHERTGWRDKEISLRHRAWGFNCPAVDLDFLMVEYNLGKAVAMVEYKHFKACMPNLNHASYRAIMDVANNHNPDPLPFLLAFYWPEQWAFRAYPVNDQAIESGKTR